MALDCRCRDCGAKFKSEQDSEQCRLCAALEAEEYKNDPTPGPAPDFPWRYSKAAMRERLGVSGDRDE